MISTNSGGVFNRMIANGVITEEQVEAFQKWMSERPEDLPFGLGLRGHGRFPGKFGPAE